MSRKRLETLSKLFLAMPLLALPFFSLAQPVANFSASPTSGCAPLSVNFSDQSTVNLGANPQWLWDFGNGQLSVLQNPIISFTQPGTYTVHLIVKDSTGINDVIKTNYITVYGPPTASFSANLTTSCAPGTIVFTDKSSTPAGSSIIGYSWNFGDGGTSNQQSPAHTFANTGFYTVSLQITNSNGCKASYTVGRYIRIVDGVDVDFSSSQPTTCKPPFLVNFVDLSAGPGTLSYSWDFGNGSTSTNKFPSTTYPTAGTYPVTLKVQSNLGCNGTITKNVVVAGKTTDFTFPATICVGQTVNFQNNSSPAPIASAWDFGDGTTSGQISPAKTFLTGGTYQVRLINNYGNCSDSITKTVTIVSSPTVAFTVNDSIPCSLPANVQFTDNSPGAATWLWDFGDSTTSTQKSPAHTYTNDGLYDVTLTITLPGGCSNTVTKQQFIKIQPLTVSIKNAPAGGCAPFSYSPVPSVQSVDSIVSYSWDLGEPGATYSTQFPTHTYNSVGSYNIKLTVTTKNGCTQTVTIPNGVETGTKPTAKFSFAPNNACASTAIQFTDQSTTTPGADVKWLWNFGDGKTADVQNPTHVFIDTGSVAVQLTVLNNGCPGTTSQLVKVLPPVAKFGYKTDCANRLNVTFSDSSLASVAYGPVTYQWDFGDGATSTLQSPTHVYTSLNTYNVTLTVTNGACTYSTSKPVKVVNEPADFTIGQNPVCKNTPFGLSAINSNPANISSYKWTIDTTVLSSSNRDVTYLLQNYGQYDVTLSIVDTNGCISTKTVPNFITVRGPVAKFAAAGTGTCINKQINFNDLSTPASAPIVQWTWNFGDGTIQDFTSSPFSHSYSQTGNYSVNLTVKDTAGCTDKFTVGNAVLITDPIAGFRADTFYCPSAPLQFTDTSTGLGLTYSWQFGDGGNSTLKNPTHAYPAGNNAYTVQLKIKDLVGCEDSVTKTNYVNIGTPKAAFDITDSSGICLPVVTSFTFHGTGYQTYLWNFGDSTTSFALSPAHFYGAYGTYTPKLYLFGPGGCVDSAQATVNAYDPNTSTTINVSPSSACNSLAGNFNITSPPGFKFKVYFGDGTVDSTQQAILTHTYSAPGNYTPSIILTDAFGCDPGVAGNPIHVYGALTLFGKSKKEFCDSGTVTFTNYTLSNDPITSTVWDFGDGTTSTAIQPTHTYTAPGMYIVQLIVTTQHPCTSIYMDTIRVYKTPVISIVGKDTICINSSEPFAGILTVPDSTIQWNWNFGNGSSSQAQNPSTSYSQAGDFTILLQAANKLGCSDTASHDVAVVPLPTATPASNPINMISGGSATLNMNYTGPIISYAWLPLQNLSCADCPQPTANPRVTTNYRVQIQDRYGCTNSGDVTVKVICNGQNFFIPNTFSPTGDGINDVFYLRGTGLFRVNSIMIFDRWGEVVFEKKNFNVNDPSAGWTGTYKGKKATPDVYIYQIEIVCDNGETIKYSGNIALIQ